MQERPGADLVCHNELMRSPSGEAVRTLSYGPYQEDMFRKLFFQGNCLSTSATVARIQALKEVGLFRGNSLYLEDYDLWLRLSKNHRIAFIPDILGEYILHDTNISKDVVWHQKSQINVLKKNFKEFSGRKITDYLRFFLRLSRLYLSIIKNSLFYD
jgi:GT2 family glycosyltransferase